MHGCYRSRMTESRRGASLIHALAFQVTWFVCVSCAARGLPWVGVAACALFVAVSVGSSSARWVELRYVAQLTLLGAVCDSLSLTVSGALAWSSPSPWLGEWLAPPWVIGLWAAFVTLGPRALSWLQDRLVLAAVLGAVAGPCSYLGAGRMGGAELTWPTWAVAGVVGLEYAAAMPVMMVLSRAVTRGQEALVSDGSAPPA